MPGWPTRCKIPYVVTGRLGVATACIQGTAVNTPKLCPTCVLIVDKPLPSQSEPGCTTADVVLL